MVSGNYLSHMRFGSYTDVNHNNNPNSNPAYVFALGSVTPQADMPKSGKATYAGLALASPIGGGVYEEGTSTFNVDFGTKKLNGSVSVGRWNPVSLTAKIDGNQFSGTSAEGIKPQVASMARKRPNWAACSIVKCPATMQA
ncbi:transferrin-binding protein-like solute binding protein [Kingella oralis]|nr:transferrin-binding protein-like solute binding protein [Kingella oralis]QMT43243.1 transferrin-binding protein-like solute binding protein [Kingella oralis]